MNARAKPRAATKRKSKSPLLYEKFTADEINLLLASLDDLSVAEQEELLAVVEELERREQARACRDDLLTFVKHMYPEYKVGRHHKRLADLLMAVERGEKPRITVSIAPRHGKSLLTSTYFPAWYLGRNPTKKLMVISHTADLAVEFGRKVRNIVASDEYGRIFPGVALAADSKSAGRWSTSHSGEFYAGGVGGALAGRGAHCLIIDDAHSEQDILSGNFQVFDEAYTWYVTGARTRLMSGGSVAIVGTRWSPDDLIGRAVAEGAKNPEADQFEVFEFPAILESVAEDGSTVQKALWPEMFPLASLLQTKATMPTFQWNAQYQQQPTSEEAAIIPRDAWRRWRLPDPPDCEYVIMALDAAAEAHNRADYTAITTWGVFYNEENSRNELILLNSMRMRIEFPELKKLAMAQYRQWEPDSFIVEKKSNGVALYQELRRMGMSVQEFTPSRGTATNPNTKMARLNAVADIVTSGLVWVPDTRWAEELVEEVAGFPFARNDDITDTVVMSLTRYRNGGFLRLPTDEPDRERYFKSHRGGRYY
jgi:predicted phage terminase large subunit-like protein